MQFSPQAGSPGVDYFDQNGHGAPASYLEEYRERLERLGMLSTSSSQPCETNEEELALKLSQEVIARWAHRFFTKKVPGAFSAEEHSNKVS